MSKKGTKKCNRKFTKYQLRGTNGQYFVFGHIPSNDDKRWDEKHKILIGLGLTSFMAFLLDFYCITNSAYKTSKFKDNFLLEIGLKYFQSCFYRNITQLSS